MSNRRQELIFLDALRGSINTDSSSQPTPSTGKTPLALPGSENQRMFKAQYEVEEVDDEMAHIPR